MSSSLGIALSTSRFRPSGSAPVVYTRTAFLSDSGNDGTAALNNSVLPFATLQAAINALYAAYAGQTTTIRLTGNATGDATDGAALQNLLVSGLTLRSHDATRRYLIGTVPLCGAVTAPNVDLSLVNVRVSVLSDLHTSHTHIYLGTLTADATSLVDTVNIAGANAGSNGTLGSDGNAGTGLDGSTGSDGEFPSDGSPGSSIDSNGAPGTNAGHGDSAWKLYVVCDAGFTITDLYGNGQAGGNGGAGGAAANATGGNGGNGGNATGPSDSNGGNGGRGGDASAVGGAGGNGGNGGHGSIITVIGTLTVTTSYLDGGSLGLGAAGGSGNTASSGTGGAGGSGFGSGTSGNAGASGSQADGDGALGSDGVAGNAGSIA